MTILFYFIGLIAGLFSLTNLIIAVFIFLPTARRHCLAYRRAHYINRLRNFLFGPVPYGTILMVPLIATVLFLGSWLYIRNQWFEYSLPFLAGAVTSVFFSLISLPDRSGRHKRTFNMSWGQDYRSASFGSASIASLREEQIYLDMPEDFKMVRDRLLNNGGAHQFSSNIQNDVNVLLKSFKVEKDVLREEINARLNTNASRGELPEWKKQHYLGEEAYLVNDALLSFVVSRRKDGTNEYSFESTV